MAATGQRAFASAGVRAPGDYRPPPFYAEHGIVSTVDVLIRRHGGGAP
jgi:hypothetical protein